MRPQWILAFVLTVCAFTVSARGFAEGDEYTEIVEKDYPIRSIGDVEITNSHGDVTLVGWSLDKVRIKVQKKLSNDLKGAVSYRYKATDRHIEIASQYDSALTVSDRIAARERKGPRLNFTVFAPAKLKVKIWGISGSISLKNWNGDASIRLREGSIDVKNFKSKALELICPSCSFHLQAVQGAVQCVGGDGPIHVQDISGNRIYVETALGTLKADNVSGTQTYVTKSGDIEGYRLVGDVEFRSGSANTILRNIYGAVAGSSESGRISIGIRTWKDADRILLESVSGDIQVHAPPAFSGFVDVWSIRGSSKVDFPIDSNFFSSSAFGPQPSTRIQGQIRYGGPSLKIFSESGKVSLIPSSY